MPAYRLFSWGANSHGQLGQGDLAADELLAPRQVDLTSTDLKVEEIVKIVGGAGHTLILDTRGRVYSCGWNDKGQAGTTAASSRFQRVERILEEQRIVDVACGWDSSMALAETGEAFAWGSNSHGQLGLREIELGGKSDKPLKVELDGPVQRIAMGLRHSALVTRDSRLFVSGASMKGQLGIDLRGARCSDTFVQVSGLPHVKSVSCGQHHTVALTIHNELFAWGDNKHGQLGIDPALHKVVLTPTKIEYFQNVETSNIYCGWTHTSILNSDNKVFSWGRNSYGQLCRAKSTPTDDCWKAESPTTSMNVQQLSVGSEHNVALTGDGNILSWGWNEHGNCGNGNAKDIFEPTKVMLPEGSGILVGTGAGHSFAIIKTNC